MTQLKRPAAITAARAQVLDAARILEAQLEKTAFVAGDHFTWGDIPLGAAAHRFLNLPFDRPQLKATEAWYARLRERAPYKKWIDLPLT
jgi:glutathione S-transferase